MVWGYSWIYVVIVAVIADLIIGEFPGKHPVEYLGDFVKWFEKKFYKDSVVRGYILISILIFIVAITAALIQTIAMFLPVMFMAVIVGLIASTGLASRTLKDYAKNVLFADDDKKREQLAILVTRNTQELDDKKVYSSLIESYAENLSDGVIAPLFYLILFGLPGIMVYKTVSTLDSMIGYKNEKYKNYGQVPALVDDVMNFIPARLTAFMIWGLTRSRISWKKLSEEAKRYSSSPNAGYPVAAAAYNLGVKLGGPVYYGDTLVEKAEIGEEKKDDYKDAAFRLISVHKTMDAIVILFLISYLSLDLVIRNLIA